MSPNVQLDKKLPNLISYKTVSYFNLLQVGITEKILPNQSKTRFTSEGILFDNKSHSNSLKLNSPKTRSLTKIKQGTKKMQNLIYFKKMYNFNMFIKLIME